MRLRLGTRGSPLALAQAGIVASRLQAAGASVELVRIATTGDRSQDWDRTDKGIFVAEIDQALEAGDIDIAVHSLKDVPTGLPDGVEIACVPERDSPLDAALPPGSLKSLPAGARVATSSLRRKAELLRARPDLAAVEVRGNVDTRLRKLDEGGFQALLLAEAGLKRLGIDRSRYEALPAEVMVPAPGQGALAVVARKGGDSGVRDLLGPIEHRATRLEVEAERAFIDTSGAGCHSPVGALGRLDGAGVLGLYAAIGGTERRLLLQARVLEVEDARRLGRDAARELGLPGDVTHPTPPERGGAA